MRERQLLYLLLRTNNGDWAKLLLCFFILPSRDFVTLYLNFLSGFRHESFDLTKGMLLLGRNCQVPHSYVRPSVIRKEFAKNAKAERGEGRKDPRRDDYTFSGRWNTTHASKVKQNAPTTFVCREKLTQKYARIQFHYELW